MTGVSASGVAGISTDAGILGLSGGRFDGEIVLDGGPTAAQDGTMLAAKPIPRHHLSLRPTKRA